MKNQELGSELGTGMLFSFILFCGIVGKITGPISWAEEARSYNALVIAWPDFAEHSASTPNPQIEIQGELL